MYLPFIRILEQQAPAVTAKERSGAWKSTGFFLLVYCLDWNLCVISGEEAYLEATIGHIAVLAMVSEAY